MKRLCALLVVAACNSSPTPTPTPTAIPTATPTPTAIPTATATATATADIIPPDAIIAQHVLVIYKGAKRAPKSVIRSKQEAKTRAQEARTKILSGTPFEDVVKEYSDDAGSADRMGSLGKFKRDAMDPAFGAAAFALKVGAVSDVVETPFGFHVIKRTQ